MTRPTQLSLLDALTAPIVETIEADGVTYDFAEFSGEGCEPRTLDAIPLVLRLPGEPGYVELGRDFRPVSS